MKMLSKARDVVESRLRIRRELLAVALKCLNIDAKVHRVRLERCRFDHPVPFALSDYPGDGARVASHCLHDLHLHFLIWSLVTPCNKRGPKRFGSTNTA